MIVPDKEPSAEGKDEKVNFYERFEDGGASSLASMEGAWTAYSCPYSFDDDALDLSKEKKLDLRWVGVVIAVVITVLASWVNRLPFAPFTMKGGALEHPLGVSMLCIFLGMVVANLMTVKSMQVGCRWITRWCIPVAVVGLGAGLNLPLLAEVGWVLFGIILLMMLVAIGLAYGVGRLLGLNHQTTYLLGVGTAVCGSSAILATSPVSGADEEDVLVTVGAVNLVGLLAMFICVGVLYVMPLDARVFGAWVGVTIHAVPQVIAAGESHSADAAAMASLVKLVRVTLLAPVVMLTALFIAKCGKKGPQVDGKPQRIWRYVPWFVWGFLGLATAQGFGWLPSLEFASEDHGMVNIPVAELLLISAKWLLAISMAAIGLQVKIRPMLKIGARVMAAGVITWLMMSALALWLLLLAF